MVDRTAQPRTAPRKLTILGATGSIGQSTIDIVRAHRDRFCIEALVANSNVERLAKDAVDLKARVAVVADETRRDELATRLDGTGIEAAAGLTAVCEAAQRPVDLVMAAIVGASGLKPTLAALETGATMCLANKECLVSAGDLFMRTARRCGADVIPVDSEHSAIFQCFEARNAGSVDAITLTASGGPFRRTAMEDLRSVTCADALKHPNWSMGRKITIDSATLMNKGLELIEAAHLFPVGVDKLSAVVHPQSIIHSMVSYVDGSVLAQLGVPDMRTPIAWAMAYPERIDTTVDRLDLAEIAQLTFENIDNDRFPAVGLCLNALKRGANATTILNAANEIAVAEFLAQRIGFLDIPALVEDTLNAAERQSMIVPLGSLDDVWAADSYGRSVAGELAHKLH